ncbi:hypothetical protein PsorP6_009797 [Peronosclerospora sorghi]|uniref:Uncharacterized protein n=1 Tax=Peronosclerospora sorghi TaxID=230839 RepID=A0ACC0VZL1_9STRA|nr:hypothetical protein PsorP6_009797 [Peronosclerospora sorghi]
MGREHPRQLRLHTGSASAQRRHGTRPREPNPKKAMDEGLHEQCWKTLMWKRSVHVQGGIEALLAICAYKCNAPAHDDKASYCILLAWHKEEAKTSSFDGDVRTSVTIGRKISRIAWRMGAL